MREELRGILQAYYIGIGGNVSWGNILGDIENQIDLMNQFDTKVPVARELTINGVTHDLSSNRSWTIATPDLSSYVPYTGASGDVNLGEYELKAGQIEYDQTPTGVAGVAVTRWNDSVGTLETTLKGGNVVLKHGRDLFERVVNKTGIQLTKAAYQAVRVSTAQGQRLGVALAQANNDNNSADTIGLVVETIDNNQEGMIYVVGEIDGINTTGSLQSETWADGDVLYLSPTTAGRITNVKPIAPQHLVVIGYVVYAHATQGKIYVKVMNGFELGELHDVDTTGATNGQVLKYNGTIWTAQTDSGTPSGVAGAIQFSNGSAFASDATNFFWDDANNRLGIGINVPTATLNIKGSGTTTTFSQINTDSAGNDTFQVRDDGCVKIGGGSFGHPANTRFQVNNGSTGVLRLDTTTIYVPDTISTLNNSVLTIEGNSSGLVLQPINGNLGTVNIGGGKVNNASYSSQTKKLLQLNQGWTSVAPSLDLTINSLELNNAIDMTNGTGTKIFRGIYHNPTITGVTDHRAFQSSSGGGYFNTSAVDASAVLQADSTTQGFLMPRMTGIQVEGISTPSEGLIVYALSAGVASVTSKGIYHYTGSTWEKINGGGGGGSTFADNVFEIYDNIDNTKKLAFQASGITTGTTRTLTIPNASGTIALTSDLASYVPYTGATTSVNLGANNLTATAGTFSGAFAVGTNAIYRVAGSSKVSFGTTVQNYQFTLYATGNDNRLHFLNNTTGTAVTDGTFMGLDDGINFSFWQRENGYIRFGTNETERLRITGSGLVGIGIDVPLAKLHVVGTGTTSGTTAIKVVNSASYDVLRVTDDGNIQGIGFRVNPGNPLQGELLFGTSIDTYSVSGGQRSLSFLASPAAPGTERIQFGAYTNGQWYSQLDILNNQSGSTANVYLMQGAIGFLGIRTNNPKAPVHIGTNPTASANYGTLSLGTPAAFDGATSGFFTGVAAGTAIAVNLATGGTSDLLNMQVAGVNRFKVSSAGVVSINAATTNDSAQLQVDSTTKGFAMPRMTGAQVEAISTPLEGLIAYASSAGATSVKSKGVYHYTGSAWEKISGQTVATITFIIDGGGSAITTGIKGDIEIPFACTINQVTMLADTSGSIVVDIWKDTYANYPPTVGDTITASAKPTISAATKSQDATLTGWTNTISAGDTLRFNVDSASTVTRVTISLKITKS